MHYVYTTATAPARQMHSVHSIQLDIYISSCLERLHGRWLPWEGNSLGRQEVVGAWEGNVTKLALVSFGSSWTWWCTMEGESGTETESAAAFSATQLCSVARKPRVNKQTCTLLIPTTLCLTRQQQCVWEKCLIRRRSTTALATVGISASQARKLVHGTVSLQLASNYSTTEGIQYRREEYKTKGISYHSLKLFREQRMLFLLNEIFGSHIQEGSVHDKLWCEISLTGNTRCIALPTTFGIFAAELWMWHFSLCAFFSVVSCFHATKRLHSPFAKKGQVLCKKANGQCHHKFCLILMHYQGLNECIQVSSNCLSSSWI